MEGRFLRTEMLLGKEAMEKLSHARVAVFGVGGVGGYCVEALARCGIGTLDLIDHDVVSMTNINRQIHATTKTLGRYKVEVAAERCLEINPDILVHSHHLFYGSETSNALNWSDWDYIVDAIDTVSGKIELVLQAKEKGIPIISSMGAGNKLNPTGFEVADIYETSVCPLAKVMRKELRSRGVEKLKVVYSKETPIKPAAPEEMDDNKRNKHLPGSVSFVPSVVGLILAGEVVRELVELYWEL